MVELRWIMKTVPAPEFGEDIGKTEKTLQYRQFLAGTDAVGGLTVCGAKWSEWQDVPLVEGE